MGCRKRSGPNRNKGFRFKARSRRHPLAHTLKEPFQTVKAGAWLHPKRHGSLLPPALRRTHI